MNAIVSILLTIAVVLGLVWLIIFLWQSIGEML